MVSRAYSFDITPHLRPVNFLAVAIDNRPGFATIPGFGARGEPEAWYDWWAYGGIVRDVWLTRVARCACVDSGSGAN